MGSNIEEIGYDDALKLSNPLFVDVRSPGEFALDHIPRSVNKPVFDDEERALIGTLYRNVGRKQAVIKGIEIASPKLAVLISEISEFIERENSIIFYCFRGGMRSTVFSALFGSIGIKVRKLKGGYKDYRKYVRTELQGTSISNPLFVLKGLTGSGKTEIIKHIPYTIDLEYLAGHRSSAFGGLGLKPVTQKHFEGHLLDRMRELREKSYVVVEGESRKIGNIHVPEILLRKINESPSIIIEAPLERRIDLIINEYGKDIDYTLVTEVVKCLQSRLGKKNTIVMCELLEHGHVHEFVKQILIKYYDPLYRHTLNRGEIIGKIENKDPAVSAKKVIELIESHLKEKKQINTLHYNQASL